MPFRPISVSLLLALGVSAQTISLGPLTPSERTSAQAPIRHEGQATLRKTGLHRRLASAAIAANSRLRSDGAHGLRLHVTGFDAADGTLYIGKPGGERTAYTGRGPHDDGEFWSNTVFGDELVTEFQPGPSGAPLRWSVPEVSHSFGPMGFFPPEYLKEQLRCTLDVTCHSELSESAQSVAMFYFETAEGQSACSGALVRTKSGSGIPYFLTAHHCVSDQQTAASVETFWNYQTSACNAKAPDLAQAVRAPLAGARYVLSQDTTKGDYSMIVLNSIPSVARFANYDPRELTLGQPVTSVSHPLADYKRAAFGTVFAPYWQYSNASTFPNGVYYHVKMDKGATHPGSSGSPLFSAPNTISGMLSNGANFGDVVDVCGQDPKVFGYAKLSLAWPEFAKYLDDPTPASLTVSPARLDLTVRNGAADDGVLRSVVVHSTSTEPVAVTVNSADPWVRVLRPSGTAKAGSPHTTQVEFRPEYFQNRSGLIRSRLEVVSGNNGRVIPVDADVLVYPSDVIVDAKATTLETNDNCRYRLDLALNERGGIATTLTTLRINGEDYTDLIGRWFGSTELGPRGALSTSLKVCWPGRLDSYRITIAGRDSGSGRTWSNSTLIDFP